MSAQTNRPRRALSIRQPYAEAILRGIKQIEYRSRPTNIRERVYIYASLTPGFAEDFTDLALRPGDLPTGVLVGTVEIVDCVGVDGEYDWHLAHPERLPKLLKPERKAQPTWFFPFHDDSSGHPK